GLPVRLGVRVDVLYKHVRAARIFELADHVEELFGLELLALARLVAHAADREDEPLGADAVAERLEELGARVLVRLLEGVEQRPERLLVGDLAEADGRFARDLDRLVL